MVGCVGCPALEKFVVIVGCIGCPAMEKFGGEGQLHWLSCSGEVRQ